MNFLGYRGSYCDECDVGYYDKDQSSKITICEPCNCNPYGAVPQSQGYCNEYGTCTCRDGFTGDKCDKCTKNREYIKDGVCSRKFFWLINQNIFK